MMPTAIWIVTPRDLASRKAKACRPGRRPGRSASQPPPRGGLQERNSAWEGSVPGQGAELAGTGNLHIQ